MSLNIGFALGRKLEIAFERNGWSYKDVDEVSAGKHLGDMLEVQHGRSHIVRKPYPLQRMDDPMPPKHPYVVKTHRQSGNMMWSFGDVHRVTSSRSNETIKSVLDDIRAQGHLPFNVKLLELWMKYPALMSSECITGRTLFADTLYESRQDIHEYMPMLWCEFGQRERAFVYMIRTDTVWDKYLGVACVPPR